MSVIEEYPVGEATVGQPKVLTGQGGRLEFNTEPFQVVTLPYIGDDNPLDELSNAELKAAGLVSLGLSNKEVAERLAIETSTVERHLTHIQRKIEVGDRIKVGIVARSAGVFARAIEEVRRGPDAVFAATRMVMSEIKFGPGVQPLPQEVLSPKQQDVLALISCFGMADVEIARALGITSNTVRDHTSEIYHRLNVRSRGQAAFVATFAKRDIAARPINASRPLLY